MSTTTTTRCLLILAFSVLKPPLHRQIRVKIEEQVNTRTYTWCVSVWFAKSRSPALLKQRFWPNLNGPHSAMTFLALAVDLQLGGSAHCVAELRLTKQKNISLASQTWFSHSPSSAKYVRNEIASEERWDHAVDFEGRLKITNRSYVTPRHFLHARTESTALSWRFSRFRHSTLHCLPSIIAHQNMYHRDNTPASLLSSVEGLEVRKSFQFGD